MIHHRDRPEKGYVLHGYIGALLRESVTVKQTNLNKTKKNNNTSASTTTRQRRDRSRSRSRSRGRTLPTLQLTSPQNRQVAERSIAPQYSATQPAQVSTFDPVPILHALDSQLERHVESLIDHEAPPAPIPDGRATKDILPYKLQAAAKVLTGSAYVGACAISPCYTSDNDILVATTTAYVGTAVPVSTGTGAVGSQLSFAPFAAANFGANNALGAGNIGVRARSAGTLHILTQNLTVLNDRGGEAWVIYGGVVGGITEADMPRLEMLGVAKRCSVDGRLNTVTIPMHNDDTHDWSTTGFLRSTLTAKGNYGTETLVQSYAPSAAFIFFAPDTKPQTWKIWVKYSVEYEVPAVMNSGSAGAAVGAVTAPGLPHPMFEVAHACAAKIMRSLPADQPRPMGGIRSWFGNAFGWLGRKTKEIGTGLVSTVGEAAKGHISKELKAIAPELLALL